jgi:hypothetical protein
VPQYRVCFEGRWQADFDELEDAVEWAREVADTGRLVHVAKSGRLWTKLVGIFPEDRAEEGRMLWRARFVGSAHDGS